MRIERELRRPGGARAGAPLQSRFSRRRQGTTGRRGGQQRRYLGVYLRRRLLGRVSQARRSRRRDPADQNFRLAGLVQGAAAAGSAPMSRRPYVRKVKRSWWLARRRYVVYMVRELTSLFVGVYGAVLAGGLWTLPEGRA